MSAVVGISIGNATAAVAVSRAQGQEAIIANADGDRTTPTVIGYDGEDINIGLTALQGLLRNAKNSPSRFVGLLGAKFSDPVVSRTQSSQHCKIVEKDGQPSFHPAALEEPILAQDLVTMVLSNLWTTAKTQAGESADTSTTVVMSTPQNWSIEQKDALTQAASKAGITVKQIIPEPLAVALAYGVGCAEETKDETIIVYDIGATTACATLVKSRGGALQVLDAVYDTSVSGDAFDDTLIKFLIKEFKKTAKMDISGDARAMSKLKAAAVEAKQILSTRTSTTVAIESLFEGVDFQYNLPRGRFDSTMGSLYRKCVGPITQLLEQCKLENTDVSKILLCGGAAKTPKIKGIIGKYFDDSKTDVEDSVALDEAMAIGSARQAWFLNNRKLHADDALLSRPSLSKEIAVKAADGTMPVVLSAGTPLPTTREVALGLSEPDQSSITVEIHEATELIAEVTLTELPAGAAVTLSLEVSESGELNVVLKDTKSGKSVEGTVSK